MSGGANASFVYDGDTLRDRVKGTVNGVTTVYVGSYYEYNVSTGVATSYYYAGSQRVAMKQGSTVYYLFGEHLGSTSVSYRVSDGQTLTQRYYAWGGIRPGPNNALPTDYTFTGQKLDATGLMYYGARYYDASLGRFLSADTIVPSPGNPQTLNRYSYVNNRPCNYKDPSGHCSSQATVNLGTAIASGSMGTMFSAGLQWMGDCIGLLSSQTMKNTMTTPSQIAEDVQAQQEGLKMAGEAYQETTRLVDEYIVPDAFGVAVGAQTVEQLKSGDEAGVYLAGTFDAIYNRHSQEFSVFGSPAVGVGATTKPGVSPAVNVILAWGMDKNRDYSGPFDGITAWAPAKGWVFSGTYERGTAPSNGRLPVVLQAGALPSSPSFGLAQFRSYSVELLRVDFSSGKPLLTQGSNIK